MAEFNLPPIKETRASAQGVEGITQELENASTRALTRLDPQSGLMESLSRDIDSLDISSFSEKYRDVFGSTSKAQEAFALNNINRNREAVAEYNLRVFANTEQGKAEMAYNALTSVAKLPIIAGETVAAVGNFVSGGALENATGIGAGLAGGREWVNSIQSPGTRASREVLAIDMANASEKAKKFLLEQSERNGGNSALDYVRAYGTEGVEGVINFFKNPAAAADSVLESGLIFALPAAAAAGVRKVALSQLSREAREEFLRDTARMTALRKQEALAALITIAGLEAGGDSLALQNQVLNMSFEELGDKPMYQEALAEGMSPEEARNAVAANTFMTAYTINALGAAAVSKALGTDHVAASLFNRMVPNAIVNATARETAEEFLQSGGGALIGNFALQQNVDPNQSLMEGVTSQAGFGAVSGGISAGATQGLVVGGRALRGRAAKKIESVVAPVVEAKNTVSAINSQDFDSQKDSIVNKAVGAVDTSDWNNVEASLSPAFNGVKQALKDPNATDETKANALALASSIRNSLVAKVVGDVSSELVASNPESEAIKQELLNADPTLDDVALEARVIQELIARDPEVDARRAELVRERVSKLQETEFYKKEVLVTKNAEMALAKSIADGGISDATSEKKMEELVRILGSNPNVSVDTFDKLIKSNQFDTLDEETKAKVVNNRELSKVLNSQEEVASYVSKGGKDKQGNRWIGVTEWVESFNNSMDDRDFGSAKFNRDGLAKFLASHKAKLASRSSRQEFGGYKATTEAIRREVALMESQLAYMDQRMSSAQTQPKASVAAPAGTPTQTNTNTQPTQQRAPTASTGTPRGTRTTSQTVQSVKQVVENNQITENLSTENIDNTLAEIDQLLADAGMNVDEFMEAPTKPSETVSEPSNTNTQAQAEIASTPIAEASNDNPTNRTTAEKAKPSKADSTVSRTQKEVKPTETKTEEVAAKEPKAINVWFGSNQNSEFSNLAGRPFDYEGRSYRSVEHAYQSLKSGQFDETTYNKYKKDGVKIVGKKGTKTAGNWNVNLMNDLVYESFRQNPEAAKALVDTGNAKFTHTQDRGIWREAFPAALEAARDLLAKEDTQAVEETSKEPAVSDDQLPFGIKRDKAINRAEKRKDTLVNRFIEMMSLSEEEQDRFINESFPDRDVRNQARAFKETASNLALNLMEGVVDVSQDTEGKSNLDMISIIRAKPYLYLANKEGGLSEQDAKDVAIALTKAVYDEEGLLREEAGEDTYKKILGLGRKDRLSKEQADSLKGNGIPSSMFVDAFRKAYTEITGNRSNETDRTGITENVIDSLAGLALLASQQEGLIEVVKMNQMVDGVANKQEDFIRLSRKAGSTEFTKEAKAVSNLVKGKFGIDLFDNEDSRKFPSIDKDRVKVQKITSSNKVLDTNKKTPQQVQDVLREASNVPARLLKDMVENFNQLPTKVREIAFGIIPDVLLKNLHVLERESVAEANNSKRREIENFDLFADYIYDKAVAESKDYSEMDIYFEYEMWANGRMGIKNSAFNPQNSKGIRHLTGFKGSEVKVDTSKPDSTEYQGFMVAMGLAMGLKINNFKNIEDLKQALRVKMGEPEVKLALKALRSNDWSDGEAVKAFESVLSKGEGRTYAYQAMVNYIKFEDAARSKTNKEFVNNLTIEIDGKTNGVVLGLLGFYSGKDKSELARLKEQMRLGYIFTSAKDSASDVDKDHYTYFLSSLATAYKNASGDVSSTIKNGSKVEEVSGKTVKAYEAFFGNLSRSMVKDVVMTSFYGASLNRIMANFFEARISDWYASLVDDSTRDQAIANMKNLIASGGAVKRDGTYNTELAIRFPKNKAAALEFQLTKFELDMLREGFVKNNSDLFYTGLFNAYENFMKVRDELTADLNEVFEVVNKIYKAEYKKALAEQNKNPQVLKAIASIKKETIKALSDKSLSEEAIADIKKKSALRINSLISKKLTRANQRMFHSYMSKLIPSINTPWISELGSNKEGFGFTPIKNRNVSEEVASVERAIETSVISNESGTFSKEGLVESVTGITKKGVTGAVRAKFDVKGKLLLRISFANKAFVGLDGSSPNLILVRQESDKAKFTKEELANAEIRTFKELGINLAAAKPVSFKPKNQFTKVNSNKENKSFSLMGNSQTKVLGSPGVGGVVGMVHPIDGYIQSVLFRNGLAGMSAFDANFLPIDQYQNVTEVTNQATYEVLKEFNPLQEIANFKDKVAKLAKEYDIKFTQTRMDDRAEAHAKFLEEDYSSFKYVNQYTAPFEGGYAVRSNSRSTDKKAADINRGLRKSEKAVKALKGAQVAAAIKDNVAEALALEDANRQPTEPSREVANVVDNNDYEGLFNNEDGDVRDNMEGYDTDTLGSSPITSSTTNEVVGEWTLQGDNFVTLYDSLEAMDETDPIPLSQEHDTRLRGLLETVVKPLVDSVDLMVGKSEKFTQGLVKLSESTKPSVNIWLGSKIPHSNKQNRHEVYVHELLHAALYSMVEDGSNKYTREITKLFEVAAKFLKPTDLLANPNNYTQNELYEAEALWNYMFSNTTKTPKREAGVEDRLVRSKANNDGLHEFVVYGLTNERVIKALSALFNKPEAKKAYRGIEEFRQSDKRSETANTISKWVDSLINYVREAFRNFVLKMDKVDNLSGDQTLQTLVLNMTRAKARSQGVLINGSSKLDSLNLTTKQLVGKVVSPLATVMSKSNVTLVKGIGSGINIIKKSSGADLAQAITNIRNDVTSAREGFVAQLAREFIGRTADNRTLHNLLLQSRRYIDNARIEVSNIATKTVKESFHRALEVEESSSIGRAVMYTDLSSIYDGTNIDEVTEYLLSSDKRQAEIGLLVDSINKLSTKYGKGIAINAENLGHYMVTGKMRYKGKLMLNSLLIADLDDSKGEPDYNVSEMVKLVDKLATLYGLDYSDPVDLKRAGKFFEESLDNKNEESESSGVEFMLDFHKRVLREAKNTSFKGREKLIQKGYVKERMNPHIGHVVVLESEVAALEKQGAKIVGKVGKDRADKSEDRYLAVSDAFSTETLTRGIISVTDEKSRGTDIDVDIAGDIDVLNNKFVHRNYQGTPIKATDNSAIPLWDENGHVKGYRYVMNHQTKLNELERLDLVEELMGQHAGNIVDIRNTKVMNEAAIDHLANMWNSGEFDTKDFLLVSETSKDKGVVEMWNLIPEETKEYIEKKFPDGFFVRKEDFNLVFGNRKLGLDSMSKWVSDKTRDTVLKEVGTLVSNLLNHRYTHIGFQGLKDLTTLAKDRVVIVSGTVMAANIGSNMLLMLVDGISPVTQVKYAKEGYVLIKQFQKDEVERQKLIFQLSDSKLTKDRRDLIKSRIKQLDGKLSNNPITELMDRGLYQTIIDDVSLVDKSYEYPSKLSKKLEPITDRVPDLVKDIGSMVYMTKDTAAHKLLTEITVMSDFLARYTTYKHMLSKGRGKEEAIDLAMDNFINYEAPTHKSIQLLNDIGLAMYTKFFIRIQKVILRQLKEKPLNSMLLLGGQSYFDVDLSDINDAIITPRNVMNRLYSPLDSIGIVATPPSLEFSIK